MEIIRTKTRATGGITEAERIELDRIAQEWTRIAYRTEPINPEKIIPAVEGIYAAAGLKRPRVVIATSPLVMAYAYGAAAWIWYCRKNATYNATRNATYNATYNATDSATRNAVAGAALAAQSLAGGGALACAANWQRVYQGGNMWAAWASYLASFRDVLGLDLPEHVSYACWEEAAREGGFRVMHEEFCIVSDFPEYIKIDNENRPHCENGPSHRWRDGWELFHWHGTAIPGEWVTGKKPSAREALTWENVEQRRAACEIIGWVNILAGLDAKVIDEDEDDEVGTLLEVEIPDSGKERFLQVRCGTGRTFALPVPPEMRTALEANSWTYGLDKLDFKPEVRT